MKKFLKIGAALAALVLGLACFAACSNGDDDGGSSGSGNISNNGGGSDNQESEKPRVTVVATYQEEELYPYFYRFYSDNTYEYESQSRVTEKGTYSGSPTQKGKVAMLVKEEWNYDVGKLLPTNRNYIITIEKYGNNLYFADDTGWSYELKN